MADKPNILVIWGDDIGITNLSCYSDGLMGYRTPNIDRIANEGMRFTDSYGEQSCTAGRSSFITGQSVFRTGLSKVGPAGCAGRAAGRGSDHRRAPEEPRLRDGPVRQEPPRRQERVPPDRARLRRVLRKPVPPERRRGPGGSRLPGRSTASRSSTSGSARAACSAARRRARTTRRSTRAGDASAMQRIQDTGPADTEAHGDVRRRVRRRSAADYIERQHNRRKPFFCWVNIDAHAPPHPHQAEEPG